MASKPWLQPAPMYKPLDSFWDSDDDAPGPRCAHTLTAVAPTQSHGPRLILFGGATAIEGGAASGVPGISIIHLFLHTHVHTDYFVGWLFGSFVFDFVFLQG